MAHVTRRLFDQDFLKRLDALSIVSRRVGTGQAKGERRTLRKGSGVEFMDYRPYAVGDDLRYVDWNIYSRLDKLLLKLYVEEEDMCLHLLVDGSASMGFGAPSKLDYALQVAAALGYISLANLERVALGVFSQDATRVLRPMRGRGQILPILDFLSGVEAGGATALDSVPRPVCPEEPRARRCRRVDGSPGSGRLCRRPQGAPAAPLGGLRAPRGE